MNVRLSYSAILILFSIGAAYAALVQSETRPAAAVQVQRWHTHDFAFRSDGNVENPFAVPVPKQQGRLF